MSSHGHKITAALATVAAAVCWTPLNGQTPGHRSATTRLSGTYELDRTRSDDAARVAQQATRSLPPGQRDRAYENLLARLDAPERLAIDLDGRHVTIASSNGPQLAFDADGRNRTEAGRGSRVITTRADVRGQVLSVSTSGDRGSDYTVRFQPVAEGLRVTRTLDSDVRNLRVTAQSVYRRVDARPDWALYDSGRWRAVPGGTLLKARLDRDLDSRAAREGDRFTMTVTSPGAYRDALLDGSVVRAEDSNGRDELVFDFDRIRLRDGESRPFEGAIQSVRTPDGHEIRVSRSGEVNDTSGYHASNAQHAAIGAALGAIIGAIAGGGKGAAIGGVAGGAGTLLLEGPERVSLPAGSEMTIETIVAAKESAPPRGKSRGNAAG